MLICEFVYMQAFHKILYTKLWNSNGSRVGKIPLNDSSEGLVTTQICGTQICNSSTYEEIGV